jgi:hypothetical protein
MTGPPSPARAVVFIVSALQGHGNADRSERSTHTLLEQMRRAAPLPAEPAKSKRIEKHGLAPDRLNADSGPGPSSTSARTVFTVQACARTSIRGVRAAVIREIGDRRAKFACRAVVHMGCARFVSRETICNPGAARRHHCLVGSGKSKDAGWAPPHVSNRAAGTRGRLHGSRESSDQALNPFGQK